MLPMISQSALIHTLNPKNSAKCHGATSDAPAMPRWKDPMDCITVFMSIKKMYIIFQYSFCRAAGLAQLGERRKFSLNSCK